MKNPHCLICQKLSSETYGFFASSINILHFFPKHKENLKCDDHEKKSFYWFFSLKSLHSRIFCCCTCQHVNLPNKIFQNVVGVLSLMFCHVCMTCACTGSQNYEMKGGLSINKKALLFISLFEKKF